MASSNLRKTLLVLLAVLILVPATAATSFGQIKIIRPPAGTDFAQITAGWNHTCVRRNNGDLYCWGLNNVGQVGVSPVTTPGKCLDNTLTSEPARPCQDTPTFILSLSSQVATGASHTCSLSGGVASCWGSNTFGELGNGQIAQVTGTPQAVLGALSFSSLGAGLSTTCGVTAQGIDCWGKSLGDTNNGHSTLPVQVVATSRTLRAITVGDRFACAIDSTELDCLGLDNVGQLGQDPSWMPTGPNNLPFVPFLVKSLLSTSLNGTQAAIVGVSTGADYTCADRSDGTVLCADSNTSGQLGTGAQLTYGSPFPYVNIMPVGQGSVSLHGVSAGLSHVCALDPTGHAYCWGDNSHGEIGNGDQTGGIYTWPQAVKGSLTFRAIAAGASHTCAIGTDNAIYCWGDNSGGQLGIGYNSNGIDHAGNWFGNVQFTSTPRKIAAF